MKKITTRQLALAGILGGLVAVMAFTPIGFIPIGPIRATILHIPVIIAAIFGGYWVGGAVGLVFGIMSFLQAPTDPTFAPIWALGDFRSIFLIGVIALVPRVLIGLVSAFVYKRTEKIPMKWSTVIFGVVQLLAFSFNLFQMIQNIQNGEPYWVNIIIGVAILVLVALVAKNHAKYNMQVVLTAVMGTLTNTLLFILMAYNFFKHDFALAFGINVATVRDLWITAGITNGLPEILLAVVLVNYISLGLIAANKNRTA
ncbi:MAG: ECF transporter S component [Clostridia bacterium]